jgi:hypothetical protein
VIIAPVPTLARGAITYTTAPRGGVAPRLQGFIPS